MHGLDVVVVFIVVVFGEWKRDKLLGKVGVNYILKDYYKEVSV